MNLFETLQKEFEPQAKFYSIKIYIDENWYDDFKMADEVVYANIADELYEQNGRQAYIAISRFAETFIDMFVICKPDILSHEHLQELYANACSAFGLDVNGCKFEIEEIEGKNFFRRLRFSEWLDYINDWEKVLFDFGIPKYQYGSQAMIWKASEEPY